jgi:hypothetical protein
MSKKIGGLFFAVLLSLFMSSHCNAAIIFAIDLDTSTAGIQSTRTVSLGQNFDVDLYITLTGGTSASSWQVSTQYNPTSLNLINRLEINPGGMIESDSSNPTSGGLIRRLGFDAQVGPVSPFTFAFAKFNFDAISVGTSSITPGFFETGLDAAFDNNFAPLNPIFQGGTITAVPEPTSMGLVLASSIAGMAIRRRMSRKRINS